MNDKKVYQTTKLLQVLLD